MIVHDLHSPSHGDLRVVLSHGDYGHNRSWRTVLDPRPPRLAHLLAVDGGSEGEALDRLAAAVERYDAVGYEPVVGSMGGPAVAPVG